MRVWLPLLLLSLVFATAATTALAQCTGQAYFPPVRHDDVEFGQYTSRVATLSSGWEQTNCAILANDGSTALSDVTGAFRFTSGAGDYAIRTVATQPLSGSVAASCSIRAFGGNPNVLAFVRPASRTLLPGEFTEPCCFVFEAQPSSSMNCEDVPGDGDFATVTVQAGIGNAFTHGTDLPTLPQAPACGLVGLEVLLVAWPLARSLRRRTVRRSGRGGRATRAVVLPAAALVCAVSLLAAQARAETVAVGKGTDVSLLLTAFTHTYMPVTLTGTGDVLVTFSQGEPSLIRFDGGSVLIPTEMMNASFSLWVDVDATITGVRAKLFSGQIPVTNGTFDASLVTVKLDIGTLDVDGPVFLETVNSFRDFAVYPLTLPNEPTAQGTVSATSTAGGGFDLVVGLPLDVGAPVSTQTGAVWFGVEDGLVELAGQIKGVSVPTLAPWGLAALTAALCGTAAAVLRRRR